jgi:hypothetical protein
VLLIITINTLALIALYVLRVVDAEEHAEDPDG